MIISAFLVIHYIPHFLGQILPSWFKSLFCFPRMVNTRSNPAAPVQGEASAPREESLPQPPSLAEVMLEAERNRRDTNRLLERIEQNTARQQRINPVSINDFVKLYPPKFNHSIEPLNADDWLRSIAHKLRSANVAEDDKVTFAAYHLEGLPAFGGRIMKLCVRSANSLLGLISVPLSVSIISRKALWIARGRSSVTSPRGS